MKRIIVWAGLVLLAVNSQAQTGYWQQHVNYKIDVQMDVHTNRFTGHQTLVYTNNSPDTLRKVFYHLYWNAFQPNSMMDQRNREFMKVKTSIGLFEDKIKDRILHLKPEEQGYQHILSLTVNGVPQQYKIDETIMEVLLGKPVAPHSSVTFTMQFEAQVPLLIRRGGRDYPETGVRYSMSQWYPKICEYDALGWHPTPYVEREFYGVWGDFDVRITIDKNYTLGGTGDLQAPASAGDKRSWHFIARTVHDFMWAADTGYRHIVRQIPNGPVLNVLYVNHQNDPSADTSWMDLADAAVTMFPFMQAHFGAYPYKQISVINGGDGGMEYPMACLLASPNTGQAFHEMMHNWYYGMLGTNESLYAWMDEGFTTYAYDEIWDAYLDSFVATHPAAERAKQLRDFFKTQLPARHHEQYEHYFDLQKSGLEEPLTTHADHFNTRVAYDIGDYGKGDVFLEQLGYITGAKVRDQILLEYYKAWRFKHPDPNDFVRVAEKVSGLQLDWYREYWISGTKTVDYAIDSTWEENGQAHVRLKMVGKIPMPIDLDLEYKDGHKEQAYIPQYCMFGSKPVENPEIPRILCEPWKWTTPYYIVVLNHPLASLKSVEIDQSQRMADINRGDNRVEFK